MRRRRVFTRRPIRRFRGRRRVAKRRLPKRRYRKRRSGNLTLLCTHTVTLHPHATARYVENICPKLNDFAEVAPFYKYFGAFRIHRVYARVIPRFNCATIPDNIGPYYIAPIKEEVDNTVTSEQFLSHDRAKTFRGTNGAYMSFVPVVYSGISDAGAPGESAVATYAKTNYRPKIETRGYANSVKHYCGVLKFDSIQRPSVIRCPGSEEPGYPHCKTVTAPMSPADIAYELIIKAKITLYDQKNYIG